MENTIDIDYGRLGEALMTLANTPRQDMGGCEKQPRVSSLRTAVSCTTLEENI